jgi:hypothetical protein
MIEMTTRGQILCALVVFGYNHKFSHGHYVCNVNRNVQYLIKNLYVFFIYFHSSNQILHLAPMIHSLSPLNR